MGRERTAVKRGGFYDPSRLLLDKSYSWSNVMAGVGPTPVPAPAANEFRVAGYNVERFFNTNSADDVDFNPVTGKTENSSAVDVTPAAYAAGLPKLSMAVRHIESVEGSQLRSRQAIPNLCQSC